MAKTDEDLARELIGETVAPDPADDHSAHPLLSLAEIEEIRAEARARLHKERKSAAKKQMLEQETARLRAEEGLTATVGGVGDDIVAITIDLPEFAASISVNGMAYHHGFTYTVSRHVANSLRESMYRGWLHQNELDGKSLQQFHQRYRATNISGKTGVSNAPRRPDAELN